VYGGLDQKQRRSGGRVRKETEEEAWRKSRREDETVGGKCE
jgi:hypothetical protein